MPEYLVRSRYGPLDAQTVPGELTILGAAITVSNPAPNRRWVESDAAVDNRIWDMVVAGEQFRFRVLDAAGARTDIMTVDRTGIVVDLIVLNGPVQVGTFGANGTPPIARPSVVGSRGANAALASLLTALDSYGLITDNTVI